MLRSSVPQVPVLGAILASMSGNQPNATSPISPTPNNQGNNTVSSGSKNRQGSVMVKKPSLMRKQSQAGSRSENNKSTSGKSKTQQQIKNFCEFIQFFCGLSTGRMSLQEVETVILEPVVVDEAHRLGNKLMEEFDKLLKTAQIDPQEWFEYVTRKKTQMQVCELLFLILPHLFSLFIQEFISYSEFSAEILKLCVDLQHPLIGDDDVQQLFHHIAGDRDNDCFEIFNLAMAFCKYRLPPSKVKMLNLVSAQLKELGEFFRSTNTHLKDIGGISSASIATGLITSSELESIISTLVLRKELFYESGGDADAQSATSNNNNNNNSNSKASTKISTKSPQNNNNSHSSTKGTSASSVKSTSSASTPPTIELPLANNNNNDVEDNNKPIILPQKRRSSLMQSFIQSVQNVAVTISNKASNMRKSVVSIKPLNPQDFTPTDQQQVQQQNKPKPQTRQSVTSPKPKAEMHEEFAKYLDVEEKRHLENVVKMLSGDEPKHNKSGGNVHAQQQQQRRSYDEDEKKDDDADEDYENQRRHSIVRRYTVLTSAKLKPGEAPGSQKEVEYLEFEHDEDDDDDDDMLSAYHTHHTHNHHAEDEQPPAVNSPPQQQQQQQLLGMSQGKIKSPKRNSTASNNGFQKMLDSFTNRVDHVRRASTYYTKGGH